MNNIPPPYNPYMYNNQIQPPNVPTAPPMDDFHQNPISYQYPQNYMYNQPTYPPQIYTPPATYPQQIYTLPPPAFNYKANAEQYRREEIERRRREDECCCLGILATLCCCFVNVEI